MTDSIQPFGTPSPNGPGLREAFDQSVGATFFRQMLKSLRSTTGKPAYFHGGQAEEIFQSQLDEILISDMAKANGGGFSADLFKQQFPNHFDNAPAHSDSAKTSGPSNPAPQTVPGSATPPTHTTPTGNSFDADA